MLFGLGTLFGNKSRRAVHLEFDKGKEQSGLSVIYDEALDESARLRIRGAARSLEISFPPERIDEAHILYMEATEILHARAKAGESGAQIEVALRQLIEKYASKPIPSRAKESPLRSPFAAQSSLFTPNPGKSLAIDVGGVSYLRLPIKTRLITEADTDIVPLVEEYVRPHLEAGDLIFVSEKAVCITQNKIVDFGDIHPGALARFLAHNVQNNYGTPNFKGFGHGTGLAMQLFIEEAGYPRVMFAALAAALTRPFGVRGAFYYLCGKRAKSVDCPMSFTIIEYAHAAKLAPQNPDGVAQRIKKMTGHGTVILDANYRGAFSLGKSDRTISEQFIQELFRDNPLGQSDEMTPFAIVRRA